MQELTLGLSILAILIGGYAVFTLNKLMRAMDDLSSGLSNMVDKLEDVERKLQTSQRQLASLTEKPKPATAMNIIDLIPAMLQKNGHAQWIPVAMLGFKTFEAYFKKRRSQRNALAKGDVGKVSRDIADQSKGQVL